MKRLGKFRRALLVLVGILIALVILLVDEQGLAATRRQSSNLKFPISNFHNP